MTTDIADRLKPILLRNGWGNVNEYAHHIPTMLEREGLTIVEAGEFERLRKEITYLRDHITRISRPLTGTDIGHGVIVTSGGQLDVNKLLDRITQIEQRVSRTIDDGR